MNIAERVIQFLRRNPNRVFCDDCLQKELRVSKPITRMIDVLSTDYVIREIVQCERCGEFKNSVVLFRQP